MTVLHAVSTLAVILALAGLANRSRPRVHIPLMLSAFAVDMSLVLYIEHNRRVIGMVAGTAGQMDAVLQIHVALSVAAVILYLVQIVLGLCLRLGREPLRAWHRRAGWTFLACRLGNYITSFLV